MSSVEGAQTRRRARTTEALGLILAAVMAIPAASIAVGYLGPRSYRWRGFEVQLAIRPALRGETRLVFTPLGELRARTHRTPLILSASLESVSFEELKGLLRQPPPRERLEEEFTRTARRSIRHFAAVQILFAGLGGLMAPLVLRARKRRYWLSCGLTGAAFIGLAFWDVTRTFDRKAFSEPVYTGSLREADWIIALAKHGFDRAETLYTRLRNVAGQLNTLYGRIDRLPASEETGERIRILHVSDIHNNPAAVGFVLELAERMQVDAVIDTGDLTDLGLPVETRLTRGLAGLRAPYLFVAGNHDSRVTVDMVRQMPGAQVLEGDIVEAGGLRVLGLPDPSSARSGSGSVDTSLELLSAAGERLKELFLSANPRPDVVAVHSPRQAEALVGIAPLILCGHMHRAGVETREGSVICNAGTTGGAGVRYFERPEGVPFSAALLTFRRDPPKTLLYVDLIVLDGSLGAYSITRKNLTPETALPANQ